MNDGGGAMKDPRTLLLMLDGNEKKVLKKLERAGLGDAQVYYPLLPQPGGTKRTAWWAGAAKLFNSLGTEPGTRIFYWGPSRFLSLFLRHLASSTGENFVWSHWERVSIGGGLLQFYGALGVCLMEGVTPITLPTHLGNRFFVQVLEEELAKTGVALSRRGRPWPSPREELENQNGNARLTLALIAKDEEEFLAGCLEQALPYVDDIVVVDTGSRDRTVEIARAYGARVIEHQWKEDFAAARNAYLDEIHDGWIVTLDADEYLTADAGVALRRLAEKGEAKVYYLRTYNYHHEVVPHFSDQANIRMVFRTDDLRYSGKIHEQLLTSLPRELVGGPQVLHYGYLPAISLRKGKLQRNAGILEEVAAQGTPFDLYNLGLNLMSQNKPAEALEVLEKYLAIKSEEAAKYRPSAYWHAARAALASGRQDLALEYAEKACQAPMPECYFTKAQVLESLGSIGEAIAAYREAASLPEPPASIYQFFNQSDSSIRLWRARAAAAALLEKEKRYEEAEREYRQVLERDMSNLSALVGLARVKRLDGHPGDGLKWAKRAVEIYPLETGAHVEYVEILLEAEEPVRALTHIIQSELPPATKGELYLRVANWAADEEDFALALKASEKALEIDSTNIVAKTLKARSLAKLGQVEAAEAELKDAPADPRVENERGCLALAQGRLDQAEAHFRGILARDPADSVAATNLAQVLILKGKIEEALTTVYPFATSNQQSSAKPVLLGARCLNSLERYIEALNLLSLTDTATMKPEELLEWNLIQGNAHFGLENWDQAADYYFEAYSIDSENPELLFRIGLLMLRLRRWEDAENAFIRVLASEPNHQEAHTLLEVSRSMQVMEAR